ncbi:peptidylprolyl isomerase [Mesorhizobium sp. RP14(2022)]|uniref:Peptidylprolyl isomerase n=2 Tax=Mesorhizobium liriopis TaxID=2953882 RepID=A0ABT1C7W3_9HYPH|nr:peptidylprolyl isomerase [Mesorhizobium liriopis]MCO6050922.1 peptidylprolyl isomerase [Mesorhizobium liriopis]
MALPLAAAMPAAAQESQIRYVVNGTPVTSYDIQRRAAFLKLQRKQGNLNQAAGDEMVEQVLKNAEVARLRINITDQQVDDAYGRFAKNNKMTVAQLDGVMNQSGVTKEHFKQYIKAQMGWNQALGARMRSKNGGGTGRVTEQEAVRRMLDNGGNKPSATQYTLQQVIFVVPQSERAAKLGVRKREADALRQRVQGCDSTRQFAKGLIDVTVRDLGKVFAQQLPADWSDAIKAAREGTATPSRETERGVEFITICSSREVSDDRVAQMVFQNEQNGKSQDAQVDALNKTYVEELRKRAKIAQR